MVVVPEQDESGDAVDSKIRKNSRIFLIWKINVEKYMC
jgi:hypothetical protein